LVRVVAIVFAIQVVVQFICVGQIEEDLVWRILETLLGDRVNLRFKRRWHCKKREKQNPLPSWPTPPTRIGRHAQRFASGTHHTHTHARARGATQAGSPHPPTETRQVMNASRDSVGCIARASERHKSFQRRANSAATPACGARDAHSAASR
jgi:hypothetical protein